DQPGRFGQPQHPREGSTELALDGPQAGLDRPAAEVGAVVGQIEPDAHEPAGPLVRGGGLGASVLLKAGRAGCAQSSALSDSAVSDSASAASSSAASSASGMDSGASKP